MSLNTDGALSVTTKNGVTTVTTIGRAQCEVTLNPDGSLPVTIYPNIQRFDPADEPIGTAQLDTNNAFVATVPVEGVLSILGAIRKAWDAKNAPVVAPEPAPEEPLA